MTVAMPSAAAGRASVELLLDQDLGWARRDSDGLVLWLKGYEHSREVAELARELAATGGAKSAIADWLRGLDGFFALAAEGPGWFLAAVDRVRSIPLLRAEDDGRLVIAQQGHTLAARLGLGPADSDPNGIAAFALAGFTIGDDTIYRGVRQLGPGGYLLARADGTVTCGRYCRWEPWRPDDADPEDLLEPLTRLHERLIERLIESAGGRPILVPLSAGLDSRMIASGLAEAGYRNLRCFTYGIAGNREAVVSREVANRLGLDWTFVPYTRSHIRAVMAGNYYARYKIYADSLTSIHFAQDYPAIREMIDHHGIGRETIIVNGQTGDFITGNHIRPELFAPLTNATAEARRERVIDALVAKHFKHWRSLATPERLARIRRRLCEEITAVGGMPENALGDHGIYEHCEFIDRQCKYVINGQRAYEALGLDWRLPLWDREYLDFWARAPLAAKRGQALYRRVLERDNWGGVWRDLPVNPLRVRPAWLVPLRLALKAAHAPLGRDRWHRFERRYLDYWMAPLCSYAFAPYGRVARDRRGFASAVSWLIEDYLNAKGLAYDGTPLRG